MQYDVFVLILDNRSKYVKGGLSYDAAISKHARPDSTVVVVSANESLERILAGVDAKTIAPPLQELSSRASTSNADPFAKVVEWIHEVQSMRLADGRSAKSVGVLVDFDPGRYSALLDGLKTERRISLIEEITPRAKTQVAPPTTKPKPPVAPTPQPSERSWPTFKIAFAAIAILGVMVFQFGLLPGNHVANTDSDGIIATSVPPSTAVPKAPPDSNPDSRSQMGSLDDRDVVAAQQEATLTEEVESRSDSATMMPVPSEAELSENASAPFTGDSQAGDSDRDDTGAAQQPSRRVQETEPASLSPTIAPVPGDPGVSLPAPQIASYYDIGGDNEPILERFGQIESSSNQGASCELGGYQDWTNRATQTQVGKEFSTITVPVAKGALTNVSLCIEGGAATSDWSVWLGNLPPTTYGCQMLHLDKPDRWIPGVNVVTWTVPAECVHRDDLLLVFVNVNTPGDAVWGLLITQWPQ